MFIVLIIILILSVFNQLPVVDMLSSQRNNSNNPMNSLQHPPSILLEVPNYRMDCLSPIHELPTPAPSPSPTPIISRKSAFSCLKDMDNYHHHQQQVLCLYYYFYEIIFNFKNWFFLYQGTAFSQSTNWTTNGPSWTTGYTHASHSTTDTNQFTKYGIPRVSTSPQRKTTQPEDVERHG